MKKLKSILKRITALGLSAVLILSCQPAQTVQAEPSAQTESITTTVDVSTADNWAVLNYDQAEGRTTKNDGRIWTDKSVYNGDATVMSSEETEITIEKGANSNFLIGLSALSSTMSVEGIANKPLDIILVLDVSGSMDSSMGYTEVYADGMARNGTYYILRSGKYLELDYSYSRQQWYYETGGRYIYITPKTSADDTTDGAVQVYRVESKMEALEYAVKAFAATTQALNDEIEDTADQHRIAMVKFSGNISSTIGNNTYSSGGNTYNYSQVVRDFAALTSSNIASFNSAVESLNPAGATRADNGLQVAQGMMEDVRDDAQAVVIFFTDGVPTSFSAWSDDVANRAISCSKQMKDDGAWVYSVGVFDDADPTGDDSLNRYMNAVSSNYPSATGYSTQTMGTPVAEEDRNYYETAENSAELAGIFDRIARDLSGKVAEHPTHVEEGYDASKGGYVTFVDKLGDYMEVKAFDSVVYNGVEYKNQITDTAWDAADASTDVFVSDVTVKNSLNADVSIGSIIVTIERSADTRTGDVVIVKIPAALIPLACYNVVVEDGKATTERIPTTPIRAFYEVGLKNEVPYLVSGPDEDMKNYIASHTDEDGKVVFYANAFDATANATVGSTVATFIPAKVNDMYYSVEDTLIFADEACTVPVTSIDANATYYYQRVYYVEGTELDPKYETVAFQAAVLSNVNYDFSGEDGQLVVKAGNGRYTRADAYDTVKTNDMLTETADNVASPRWENWNVPGSTVSVFLGNNGRLTLVPEDTKTVSGERVQDQGTTDTTDDVKITIQDGTAVQIGDQLTYTIKAVNYEETEATVTVTDKVPAGTKFVSVDDDGVYNAADGTVTWTFTNVAAGDTKTVSFAVEVTEAILEADFSSVKNTAQVFINNSPAYNTNTTVNPPSGKKVEGSDNVVTDGIQVGEELTYYITYSNDTAAKATVYIADIIPAGTSYLVDSASHGGIYNEENNTLSWTIAEVLPGSTGTVSFRVAVNASAKDAIRNDASIKVGENGPVIKTNPTETPVNTGNMWISKTVTVPNGYDEAAKAERQKTEFALNITEVEGKLNGTYTLIRNGNTDSAESITFTNGKVTSVNGNVSETVTIKHDDLLEIQGLPAGAVISGSEVPVSGYTPTYAGVTAEGTVTVPVGAKTSNADDAAHVAITNEYKVTRANFQLKGIKELTGVTLISDMTFTFTSQECDDKGVVEDGAVTVVATATVTNDAKTADFSFSPRSFSESGTYYYLVTETASGLTGVTYDTTEYLLKIEVSDDGAGALSSDMTLYTKDNDGKFTVVYSDAEDAKVTFRNEYTPKETQLTLEGTKKLANRALQNAEFTFEVRDKNNNNELVTLGQNNADGTISFRPITYKASDLGDATSKEFTYVVTEMGGSLAGVTYSTAEYEVTVKLTNKNGQLEAVATYPAGGIVFENTYDPGSVSATLTAKKTLTGERSSATEGEFSFIVEDPSKADSNDPTADDVATGTNKDDGTVTFGSIGYTLADLAEGSVVDGNVINKTFTYTIREIKPDLSYDPFVEYSTAVYTVEVTVSYNESTGEMSVATPVYKLNGTVVSSAEFKNHVNKNYVEILPNPLSKSTTGQNIPKDATFSFSIIDMNGKEVGSGIGAANGAINFSKLSFDRIGEYNYWIEETNAKSGPNNGITYDENRYLLKITVTYDAEKSELVAEQAYYALKESGNRYTVADYTEALQAPHFSNTYAASGMATVSAKKVLNGRALEAGEFAFTLTREDNTSTTNGYMEADGTIKFANLYYTDADISDDKNPAVVKYVMSEIVPADANKLPGVTYDNTKYYVAVTLTPDLDNSANIITSVEYYTDADYTQKYTSGTGDNVPVFTNTYTPVGNASTEIVVSKILSGRSLEKGEFSFELQHVTDSGPQTVEVATNDADGNIKFIRTYYAANWPVGQDSMDVKYLIREVKGGLGGVTYSDQVFGVKLTVVNNTTTGNLEVASDSIKYYLGDDFTTEIKQAQVVFENSYTAEGTSYTPVATKTLNGRTMADNEFAFEVHEFDLETGKAGALVSSGLSKKDGTVTFTPISYPDRSGTNEVTLNYVITEVAGRMGGVDYDDSKFYLAVTVKDDGIGKVEVVPTPKYYKTYDVTNNILADEVSAIEFVNNYDTDDAIVQFTGTKVLTGRDLVKGEFNFVVKDKITGDVITYGTNKAASAVDGVATGSIDFGTISYEKADLGTATEKTFEYIVSELVPSNAADAGITVDTKSFAIAVTVKDDGNGNLTTDVKYENDVVFNNAYTPKPVSVDLSVFKHLLDKELQDEEFTFELKKGGKLIASEKNIGGVATFKGTEIEELTFTAPGEYTFTITEAAKGKLDKVTNQDGSVNEGGSYINDSSVYTVKINVTDSYKGALQADVRYYKNGVAEENRVNAMDFHNEYVHGNLTVDLSTAISATKTVDSPDGDYELKGEEFKFIIYDIKNTVISKGTNDANGKITFDEITFDAAGIYHYWIVEDDATKPGITNDSRAWELHIQVHYDYETGKLYVYTGKDSTDVTTYPMQRAAETEVAPAFVNTYTPAPVNTSITVTKELSGRPMISNEFAFELYEVVGTAQNSVETLVAEAANDAEGNVTFTFDIETAGTHKYKVVERIPAEEEKAFGVVYDTTVVEGIEVVVENDQANGKLVVDRVNMPDDSTFENNYIAAKTTVVIEATKVVETDGETPYQMKGDEFTFQLLDAEGKVVAETKNTAEGIVKFEMEYTDAMMAGADEKTFAYTIQEVIPAEEDRIPGMIYNEKAYGVTVTVTDDFEGSLHAKVAYEDNVQPVITNYKDVKVTVDILKTVTKTGDIDHTSAGFKFKLENVTTGTVYEPYAISDESGKTSFTINYDQESIGKTFVYKITEVDTGIKDMTYDKTVHTIEVTLGVENGQLKVDVVLNGKAVEDVKITFNNIYSAKTPEPEKTPDPEPPVAVEVDNVPKTGDNSDGALYIALLAASAAIAVFLLIFIRKKANKENV